MFIAPANFILAGEYFVIYGGRAVTLTCDQFVTHVQIERVRGDQFSLSCTFPEHLLSSLAYGEFPRFERSAKMLFRRAFEMLTDGAQPTGLHVNINSNIPPGQGAGSSSALCVAMVAAILDVEEQPELMSNYLQWFSRRLELNLHSPVSGVDNAAIAHRGCILFSAGQPFKRIVSRTPLNFVVATTGPRDLPTRGFEALREMRKMGSEAFAQIIDAADSIVLRLADALVDGDGKVLGHCMQASQALLEELGVSTAKIDGAIAAALEAGAYGAKLTGAGCGGFVIACVASENIQAVEAAWNAFGLKEITHFYS